MKLIFYKYEGTGNDFVMVDNRQNIFPKSNTSLVAKLCDRKFGVGADGLILLENDATSDFNMVYYNSDGQQSSMCGNGGRCLVAFANHLGVIKNKTTFNAVDGIHHAEIFDDEVSLQMIDVDEVRSKPNATFLNTGSPHHVQLVDELKTIDVQSEGAKLRYGIYGEKGSNINFVHQESDKEFSVRTYERGVEGETLSCGTGVTAVAIAMYALGKTKSKHIEVNTEGGRLKVSFESNKKYTNIFLTGPAKQVFKGEITI